MKTCKRKLLSFLLVLVMALSAMPIAVYAEGEPVTVSGEDELVAAIEAIGEGEAGEITIQNVYLNLSEGLYIENRNITFNLVNATLVTSLDEYGYGQPVIFAVNSDITVNSYGYSSMQSCGENDLGVVRSENITDYDETTCTFEKSFTLIINGGEYYSDEGSSAFVVVPGTEAVFTDVICVGKVEAIAYEGVGITVPGKITVNSGKFSNDVAEYAAAGKYSCSYGESYYVREKEFSDEFCKPLTDGKLIFNYAKPSGYEDSIWVIEEDFFMANPYFYFGPEGFTEDYSKLELGMNYGKSNEEVHVVDVVWDYDPAVLQTAQSYIDKFPVERGWFNVSDIELINYWVYHNPQAGVDSLANYSGELKAILGGSNFLFNIEVRAGSDDLFYTERIGSAKLIYDGKVYYASGFLGARAEHAIFVPESTADTKEALMAAAQERINGFFGEGTVKITAANETVTDYYNSELARYDSWLAETQSELEAAQAALAAEQAKDESLWDWNLIWDCNNKIANCEWLIQSIPAYKEYFTEQFNEGGDLHFLTKAAGDFFFNVEVAGKEGTYKFVIIKNDTSLAAPSFETVDLNTNITVTADSSALPLDTVIEVEKLTGGAEYDRIIGILNVEDNETYSINLRSDSLDGYVTGLTDGKFEVRIPIPERLMGKDLAVYYVDGSNNTVEYEVTVENGFAVFETDHFSIYTLAEKANVAPEHTQHSGGTATCCTKAVCAECNVPYGELNPANHSGGTEIRNAKAETEKEKGYTGDTYCKGCGAKIESGKDIPATGSASSPQTGDSSHLLLWTVLTLVSGGMLFTAVALKKKEKN